MKIKTIVKSIRIDFETAEMIEFLRKNKIKTDPIIRDAAKEALQQTIINYKIEIKKEKLPF